MRVESRPNVISRRRFITGGLAFRALTFIGCQEGSTYLPHTQPDISSNNTTEIAPDYKVLIKNYYPELALLSPPVTYNLNTDIPTSVHNFTNLSFNREAAEKIYQAIEQLIIDPLAMIMKMMVKNLT